MDNINAKCERLAWVSVVFAATPVILAFAESKIDKSVSEFLDDVCRILPVVVFPISVVVTIAAVSCWRRCRLFYKFCIAISVLIVGWVLYFLWTLRDYGEGF